MKKVLSTIWDVIKNILVVAMIFITISLFVMKLSGDTTNIFGYNLYYIVTPSMEPDLKVGDIILSKEVEDYDELTVGDIITYKGEVGSYAGKLITHQIIEKYGEGENLTFVTKGTNPAATIDPEIRADQVVSIMITEVPLLGDLMKLINTPAGFLIIIVTPLGICLVGEIVNLVNVFKNKEEEDGNEEKN